MADSKVKLLGFWGSPYSRRAEMGLKLKGVEYDNIEEDILNKSSLLLAYNPIHKKVPVLVHNGKPISESLIILEYIDETWEGPAILPRDPYDRAVARFWARFIDDKIIPASVRTFRAMGEDQQKAQEETIQLLKFLEDELKGKKFFGGDTIGLVDIAAVFIGFWFGIISELVGVQILTQDKFPNLCRWAYDFTNNSFVKENLPSKDKLAEYLKTRFPIDTVRK